ncbi:MAG TPA: MMPL family transporter [Stellaceae bacterium]|nr:MMPL family transporter [Stellaceae bacterium]
MANRIAAIVEASRRHAVAVTLLALLLSVLAGIYTASRITIDTDVDRLISSSVAWRQREAEMDRAFPQNVDLLVVVIDGKTAELAAGAADGLAKKLVALPSLFKTVRDPEGGDFFRREGLLFLSADELQKFSDQIIAAQPLIGTLAADPSLRGVFSALDLMAQGAAHGAAGADTLAAPLAAVAQSVDGALNGRSAPLSWQTLLSGRAPDKRELRRFILTQPALDYEAIVPGARAIAAVRDAASGLGLTPERGVAVRVTGTVAFDDDQLATLAEGAGLTTALSLGLLCLWLAMALRSLRLVVAIIVTLVVGLVACATFAVIAVGALNPISAAFAVLFIGIAVDFGIQFSVRYRDERFRADSFDIALRRTATGIGGPLAVAAAATSVGFFSFVPTDYTGVSDLGLIAGVGMLVALGLNVTLLPALLTLLRPRGERRAVGFARLAPLDRLLVERRRLVLAGAAVAALGAAALMPALRFDFNPLDLQNQRTEAMQVLNEMKADPDQTPYTAEILTPSISAARELADRLGKLDAVERAITAASFVPEDQPAKLAILADITSVLGITLTPPAVRPPPSDDEVLKAIASCAAHLKEAGGHGFEAAARLAGLLDQVAVRGAAVLPALKDALASGLSGRLADLAASLGAGPVTFETLPDDVKRDWIAADGRARVQVFPKGGAPDNAALRRFVQAVRAVAPNATGAPVTIQESANTVTHAFAVAGLIAVLAIAALLYAVLRRVRDVALVLAPLALAGLLALATGVVLGMQLNFANIITLPLLLGIGVAFDVYFVMRWRAGLGDLLQSSTARAILFSALTTGTAFGSLALSDNPGMAEMGKLLSISLAYTLLCTFIVLPALMGQAPPPQPSPP